MLFDLHKIAPAIRKLVAGTLALADTLAEANAALRDQLGLDAPPVKGRKGLAGPPAAEGGNGKAGKGKEGVTP